MTAAEATTRPDPDTADESLLSRLALIALFLVFPAVVLFHLGRENLRETMTTEIDLRQKQLTNTARVIEGELSREVLLRGFVEYSGGSRIRLAALMNRLAKRFPQTFQWVAWDQRGELVPLPVTQTLPGKKMWTRIAREFFLRPGEVGARLKQPGLQQALLPQLQSFLGPHLKVETFLKGSFSPLSFIRNGNEQLVFWMNLPNQPRLIPMSGESEIRGILVFIKPDNLPAEFWLEVARKGSFRQRFPKQVLVGKLGTGDGHDVFPTGLPKTPEWRKALFDGLSNSSESAMQLDDWIIRKLQPGILGDDCLFVAAPIMYLRLDWQKSGMLLNILLFLGLVIATGLLWLNSRGAFAGVSLRWKIAAYLIGAMLLPASAGLYFARTLLIQERLRGLQQLRENLRRVNTDLAAGYSSYSERYGKRLYERLQSFPTGGGSLPELREKLDRLLADGMLSRYYLSDEHGNLSLTGSLSPVGKESLGFISLLVKSTFNTSINPSGDASSSFGEVMLEEASRLAGQEGGRGLRLARPSRLIHYQFGKLDPNLMYVTPIVDGKPRLLLLDVENKLLAESFSQEELAGNRFRGNGRDESGVELSFLSFQRYFPPGTPVWTHPLIECAIYSRQISEGEIHLSGEDFYYFVPGRVDGEYLRPILLTSLRPIQRRTALRKQQSLIAAILAFGAVVFLGWSLSLRFLIPIRRLEFAFQQVGTGDLQVMLPIAEQDEIGRMSIGFNRMTRELRERERLRAYVSDTVLEAVERDQPTGHGCGELIEATILFSDVRSFTTLCENHPPEALFQMLNSLFSGVEEIIRRSGGRVDKFIGDAVMAVFLTPGEKQALDAVMCAHQMKVFLADFNQCRQAMGLFPVEIGVGISSGKVLLGDIGSERRKDLTVIGDEVNIAARLESASKQGRHTGIILSEHTHSLVRPWITAEEMPLTPIKGKNRSVHMFELIEIPSLSTETGQIPEVADPPISDIILETP